LLMIFSNCVCQFLGSLGQDLFKGRGILPLWEEIGLEIVLKSLIMIRAFLVSFSF
jgi:hypothetical protein